MPSKWFARCMILILQAHRQIKYVKPKEKCRTLYPHCIFILPVFEQALISPFGIYQTFFINLSEALMNLAANHAFSLIRASFFPLCLMSAFANPHHKTPHAPSSVLLLILSKHAYTYSRLLYLLKWKSNFVSISWTLNFCHHWATCECMCWIFSLLQSQIRKSND